MKKKTKKDLYRYPTLNNSIDEWAESLKSPEKPSKKAKCAERKPAVASAEKSLGGVLSKMSGELSGKVKSCFVKVSFKKFNSKVGGANDTPNGRADGNAGETKNIKVSGAGNSHKVNKVFKKSIAFAVVVSFLTGSALVSGGVNSQAYNYDKSNYIVAASLKYLNQKMDCYALVMHALYDAGYPSSGQSSPGVPWVKYQNYGHKVSRSEMIPGDILYFAPPMQHWAIYAGNGITINGGYLGYVKVAPLSTVESWNGAIKEVWRMNGNSQTYGDTPFTDIASVTEHRDNINWMYVKGFVYGTSSSKYSPNNVVTRASMASYLWKLAGKPNRKLTSADYKKFTDLDKKSVHYENILWLSKTGITICEGEYSPNNVVTRASMATFLYKLAGGPKRNLTAADYKKFSDLDKSSPHYENIIWLAKMGITVRSGTYMPDVAVNRGSMASFLKRFYVKVGVHI